VASNGAESISHEFVFVPGCSNTEDKDNRQRNGNASPPWTSPLLSAMNWTTCFRSNLLA
jgi:hypothetical protein